MAIFNSQKDINMKEEWKAIPGFEGLYDASTLGRIRVKDRFLNFTHKKTGNKCTVLRKGRVLKLQLFSHKKSPKYQTYAIILNKDKIQKRHSVHTLILLAFVGKSPEHYQCCHNDGNSLNNNIDNLRWDTASNNQKDRRIHGTNINPCWLVRQGTDHHFVKLTDDDIKYIRSIPYYRGLYRDLAKKFNVGKVQIGRIISRKQWKHI